SKKITLLKIYRAERQGDKWGNVTELPFNSDSYSSAHPAISTDGKFLYFASDMPGTFGQSDIFRVAILEGGKFGKPENLGAAINTEGRETFPSLTDEGELYFATDGRPGLGGLDIYRSEMDDLGNFGNPQNIGAPANSPKDDFAYLIDTKTRIGYLTSNRDGGKGYDDIYKFKETRSLRCKQELEGTVTDRLTAVAIPNATLTLYDDQYKMVSKVQS